MMDYKITLKGNKSLEQKLLKINKHSWEKVVNKNLTEIFNRGARSPGTPIRTGELARSRRVQLVNVSKGLFRGSMGYVKDYAPHVEYGHRLIGGGFVPGKKYLHNSTKAQRSIYREDMLNELRGL